MSDRIYYCFCEDNCKFETMTKEQILAAIAQATGNNVVDVDAAVITKVKELNKGEALTFWVGTRKEYNALSTEDKYCHYIITDDTTIDDLSERIEQVALEIKAIGEHTHSVKDIREVLIEPDFANLYAWREYDADPADYTLGDAAALQLSEKVVANGIITDNWDAVSFSDRFDFVDYDWQLVEPQTITLSTADQGDNNLVGKYIKKGSALFYIPSDAYFRSSNTGGSNNTTTSKIEVSAAQRITAAKLQRYIPSFDASAYPDNGEQDGLWYVKHATRRLLTCEP